MGWNLRGPILLQQILPTQNQESGHKAQAFGT